MSEDLQQLLKASGYLNSPANRFFWRNATPTLRSHLWQLLVLAISTGLPCALLLASLTTLGGMDRFILFGFYFVWILIGFAVMDPLFGLAVRVRRLETWWSGRWLNVLPLFLGALLLIFFARGLRTSVTSHMLGIQFLIWTAMAISAWIAANGLRMLIITRLYWHGINPPPLHRHPLLTVAALGIIILFSAWRAFATDSRPLIMPTERPPLLLLAFDVPEPLFEDYTALVPAAWPKRDLNLPGEDITTYWTSLGSGTGAAVHRASLQVYQTPLFTRTLNRRDPTQTAPIFLMKGLGLARPMTGSGRYRRYFWEILDGLGLRAYSFSFWHTFPAFRQNGGVLSERWSPGQDQPPFMSGLQPIDPIRLPPVAQSEPLRPTIQREGQTWAQVRRLSDNAGFDLCMAYFPLADLIRDRAGAVNEAQQNLLAYRRDAVREILENLPGDSNIGILIASGKPLEGQPIRTRIISNWLFDIAGPMESHMELAPTLLNYYGLPADRLMAASRYLVPLATSATRVDYGEPGRDALVTDRSDAEYYEELKSLGYVQ